MWGGSLWEQLPRKMERVQPVVWVWSLDGSLLQGGAVWRMFDEAGQPPWPSEENCVFRTTLSPYLSTQLPPVTGQEQPVGSVAFMVTTWWRISEDSFWACWSLVLLVLRNWRGPFSWPQQSVFPQTWGMCHREYLRWFQTVRWLVQCGSDSLHKLL